ncbi:MAG: glycosyltransferase [Lysobacteraceae bacterium]
MPDVPVTFYTDVDDAALASWRALQPDREPGRLLRGDECWIAQTHARLRDAGVPVRLDNRVPGDGVIVFYAGDKKRVWRAFDPRSRAMLVAVRSDRHPVGFADVEVVQNASSADGVRTRHVPHWPQAGLLPRDPARGATVRTVLFPGTPQNLHPGFAAPAWHDFIARHGLEFRCHYAKACGGPPAWHDYRDVDVMLAIRPAAMGLVPHKPAWKLFNAWLAGVPAILGPEAGYRELRRGPLDYLEAADPGEATRALQRLLDEPGLYAAMVDNGRVRGAEFTVAANLARWRALLDALARECADPARRPPSRLARQARDLAFRLRRAWRPYG